METLFVNACMRGERSRTLELCRAYLEGRENVTEVNVAGMGLAPFTGEQAERRAELEAAHAWDDPVFDLAKQFAAADGEIVIGAPYWDLSFPAALKTYIEHVSVCDITFHYTEQGTSEGMCKAPLLTYLTACGGFVEGANYGYEYLCGIAKMFGIPATRFVAAEGLDVIELDTDAQMAKALAAVRALRG